MNIMINFDEFTGENSRKRNPCWLQISDHLYRILIVGDTESGIVSALTNLVNHQPGFNNIYLYAKYQFLINKHEDVGINHSNDPKI